MFSETSSATLDTMDLHSFITRSSEVGTALSVNIHIIRKCCSTIKTLPPRDNDNVGIAGENCFRIINKSDDDAIDDSIVSTWSAKSPAEILRSGIVDAALVKAYVDGKGRADVSLSPLNAVFQFFRRAYMLEQREAVARWREVAWLLIDYGAAMAGVGIDVAAMCGDASLVAHIINAEGVGLREINFTFSGGSALRLACTGHHREVAELLVSNGCSTALKRHVRSPHDFTFANAVSSGSVSLCQQLISQERRRDNEKYLATHRNIDSEVKQSVRYQKVVRSLLSHTDGNGRLAFACACCVPGGDGEAMVRYLLSLDASIVSNYSGKESLLMLAAEAGNIWTMRFLMEAGLTEPTLLHKATLSDVVLAMACALELEANVNATDINGNTPLHIVRSVAAAKFLLDQPDICVNILNNDGDSALAVHMPHNTDASRSIIELLLPRMHCDVLSSNPMEVKATRGETHRPLLLRAMNCNDNYWCAKALLRSGCSALCLGSTSVVLHRTQYSFADKRIVLDRWGARKTAFSEALHFTTHPRDGHVVQRPDEELVNLFIEKGAAEAEPLVYLRWLLQNAIIKRDVAELIAVLTNPSYVPLFDKSMMDAEDTVADRWDFEDCGAVVTGTRVIDTALFFALELLHGHQPVDSDCVFEIVKTLLLIGKADPNAEEERDEFRAGFQNVKTPLLIVLEDPMRAERRFVELLLNNGACLNTERYLMAEHFVFDGFMHLIDLFIDDASSGYDDNGMAVPLQAPPPPFEVSHSRVLLKESPQHYTISQLMDVWRGLRTVLESLENFILREAKQARRLGSNNNNNNTNRHAMMRFYEDFDDNAMTDMSPEAREEKRKGLLRIAKRIISCINHHAAINSQLESNAVMSTMTNGPEGCLDGAWHAGIITDYSNNLIGTASLARLLLDNGVSMTSVKNNKPPAEIGSTSMVLLSGGSLTKRSERAILRILRDAFDCGLDPDEPRDQMGRTLLSSAVVLRSPRLTRLLVSNGADPRAADRSVGGSPLGTFDTLFHDTLKDDFVFHHGSGDAALHILRALNPKDRRLRSPDGVINIHTLNSSGCAAEHFVALGSLCEVSSNSSVGTYDDDDEPIQRFQRQVNNDGASNDSNDGHSHSEIFYQDYDYDYGGSDYNGYDDEDDDYYGY